MNHCNTYGFDSASTASTAVHKTVSSVSSPGAHGSFLDLFLLYLSLTAFPPAYSWCSSYLYYKWAC